MFPYHSFAFYGQRLVARRLPLRTPARQDARTPAPPGQHCNALRGLASRWPIIATLCSVRAPSRAQTAMPYNGLQPLGPALQCLAAFWALGQELQCLAASLGGAGPPRNYFFVWLAYLPSYEIRGSPPSPPPRTPARPHARTSAHPHPRARSAMPYKACSSRWAQIIMPYNVLQTPGPKLQCFTTFWSPVGQNCNTLQRVLGPGA